jgi:hypothetical protein
MGNWMRLIIRKRSEMPSCLRPIKRVKGICVGECVLGGKMEHPAHAHCDNHHKWNDGWICVRFKYMLKQPLVLLHEAAHLLVDPGLPSHGKEWRQAVVSIGGTYKQFGYPYHGQLLYYPDYTHTRSGNAVYQRYMKEASQ